MAATISVICPNCRNQMRASVDHIGRKGKCPNCQSLVEIRASPEETARSRTVATVTLDRRSGGAGNTDVPSWLSALIGAGLTVVLYLAIFLPVRSTYLGELFVDRGVIPVITTLVTCWGLAHLALKYRAVQRQRNVADLELQLIPLEIGMQVTNENVDQFLDHLSTLPARDQNSVVARRIRGALEHFKHRNSVPEVQQYLSSQAEIDGSTVDAGYTLLRSIIWCVPILGFIGTVVGISSAVSDMKAALQPAQPATANATDAGAASEPEPDAQSALGSNMMKAMGGVTAGLSVAFDTTLVALAFAILLLFPTEALRKLEYAMLDRIEEFSNESLLRRMSDVRGSAADMPTVVKDALHSAFHEHQRWLAQWQAQVGQLGQVIGADFEQAVDRAQDQVIAAESARLQQLRNAAQAVEELFGNLGAATETWERSAAGALKSMEASVQASERLGTTLSRNLELLNAASERAATLPVGLPSSSLPETALMPPPGMDGHPRGPGIFNRWFGRG
jgi:biopolymer transport protein ExbB/TolQ